MSKAYVFFIFDQFRELIAKKNIRSYKKVVLVDVEVKVGCIFHTLTHVLICLLVVKVFLIKIIKLKS
jgi:hypothetical protein